MEKQYTYSLQGTVGGNVQTISANYTISEVITVQRVAATGNVAQDFKVITNTVSTNNANLQMTAAEAAGIASV
ncbi:MAG TPA: hypothetical protein VHY37_04085, partial [Tepidisphaeraceae bacterium]|nr:hypothetical protein [Tepidisphaeraceae bacterium]